MTYAEAEAYLLALPRFAEQGAAAMKPGLERTEALLEDMGRPHARFRSVHVGGTNGKGSTASMLAAIAAAAGLRTGLHTSPHLHDLAERMRVGGQPAPHDWLAETVARFRSTFDRAQPSFFEVTVALSFLYFAEREVDLAVVEVGLGGRLDATNVLRPEVAIVTNVGRDHAEILGETPEQIAREKAGIAKPGVPLLTAAGGDSVQAALRAETEARGGHFRLIRDEVTVDVAAHEPDRLVLDLTTPLRRYERLGVGLAGRHQAWNAALAVRAAELTVEAVQAGPGPVVAGLSGVRKLSGLAGRCEILQRHPHILADVAHNAEGVQAALAHVRELRPERLFVLLGVMRDKEPAALAAALAESGATVLPVPLSSPRALPLDDLRRTLRTHGVPVVEVNDLAAAFRWFEAHARPRDLLLATGSHLTAAAARAFLSDRSIVP